MARKDQDEHFRMTRPGSFAGGMLIFLIFVSLICLALAGQIAEAFTANRFLNGLIVLVLAIGIFYSFAQIFRLRPAVRWIERYRMGDPGDLGPTEGPPPTLLAPMAAMLRDRPGAMTLSATALRSILDSIGTRLDETREISRYMIGLLVFLGLLGTFWGLLQTIGSVKDAIAALSPAAGASEQIFEDLIAGLETPLAGMALAFSSSLFGLSGSLILGFLDIRAGQAQNRFYNELEELLSTRTQIASEGGPQGGTPYANNSMAELTAAIDVLRQTIVANIQAGQGHLSDQDLEALKAALSAGEDVGPSLDRLAEVTERSHQASATATKDMAQTADRLNAAVDRLVGDNAAGAAETIQDVRNDIRVLTKTIVTLADRNR